MYEHITAFGNCSISDEREYRNMRVVLMENEFLRIGILVGRGSDIFEFIYKPENLNLLLQLSRGIENPREKFSQIRSTNTQFEDYYYGGWQEILPNAHPFIYKGAHLGQHGEISLIPWEHEILCNSPEEVSVRLRTRPLRIPLLLEKTLTLKKGEKCLHVHEQLRNVGREPLDIMWGHHIAFGLPFLDSQGKVSTNAQTFYAEPTMPEKRRFTPGIAFPWPKGRTISGEPDDASIIPVPSAGEYSELCYLEGYGKDAFYELRSEARQMSFRLSWDGELFKCLWMWQERNAIKGFPWWGDCYAVALEPWTSPYTSRPEQAIANNEWLLIEPDAVIETSLNAEIINHKSNPNEINH